MARNYPASTTMQKCLEERYRKEESAQFEWFFRDKLSGKGGGAAKAGSSKQYEVFKRKIELAPRVDGLASRLPQAQQRSFHKKRFGHDGDVLGNEEEEEKPMKSQPIMFAIDQPVKEMLYDGFSKEGKGRTRYLSERKKKGPEEKYSFPVLSSNEYGWRLGDVIKKEDIKKSVFARHELINDTFFTRNGIPLPNDMWRSKTVF